MPYKSEEQRAKFHELLAQGKISPKVVEEFDRASVGLKLPKRHTALRHSSPFDKDAAARRKFYGG